MLLPIIGFAQSEIRLEGGGYEIIDGAITWPDSTGQAFGVHQANAGSEIHTFWIFNDGTADLTVSNFTITAAYAAHFNITNPNILTLPTGDSISFKVEYAPIAAGTHGRTTGGSGRANIQFTTNDPDEGTYNFSISGVATPAAKFDCSSGRMIFSANNPTDLFDWNYAEQPPTRTTIRNNWNAHHDGMAMNPNDNFIYAMRWTANNRNQLWVFDQSGEETFVGYVSGGLIAFNMNPHFPAGAFDDNDNLYVFQNGDNTTGFHRINIKSQQAEQIILSSPVHLRDAIYNPDDGLLYGMSFGTTNDGLVSINPSTGAVTLIGGDGDGTHHAMFRSNDGAVYMMTKTYTMYNVDLSNGTLTQVSANPGWGDGGWVDGAACGDISLAADLAIGKTDNRPSYVPGSVQRYAISVTNNGPHGVYEAAIQDLVPTGITGADMSWTTETFGTATSQNSGGTGELNDVINIGVGDSVVYTVRIIVPLAFTGNLTNTTTVTAPSFITDSDLSNNTATDVDLPVSDATEQCNNGFDDDGDGMVDCFDGDCAGNTVCSDHYTNGVIPDCPDTPDVALFSMLEQYSSNAGDGYITPVVGDLDSDGIPEIVTVDYSTGRLHVLSGLDGTAIANIAYQGTYHNFSGGASIADIDNDGTAEIFLVTGNAQSGAAGNNCQQWISCFDFDNGALTQRYRSSYGQVNINEYSDQKWAVVQFADFDQDGTSELFIGNHVMNAATGAIIASPTTAQRNNWPRGKVPGAAYGDYMSAAYDVLPASACANCDGLELICGNTVYAVDLSDPGNTQNGITVATQMTPTGTYRDGLTSLADWNGDGEMDIIVSTSDWDGTAGVHEGGLIYIWDPRTQTIIANDAQGNPLVGSIIDPQPTGTYDFCGARDVNRAYLNVWCNGRSNTRGPAPIGRTTVADFDGDGYNEITVVGRDVLICLDGDLSVLWTKKVIDGSSNTSATAFDFEGDGAVEVVYRDEEFLRIIDGATGDTKDSLSCTSGTRVEMPIIVDVDADGEAEIVVSCGGSTVVYTSNQTPWMPTRKVWNSLHYTPTFINDDLTIPAHRQDKASIPRLDVYAAQTYITDPSGAIVYPALPDFVVTFDSSFVASCDDDSTLVYVTICNDDANALLYDYPVSYYNGDPNSGGTLIGTRIVTNADVTILSTNCYQYTFNASNQPTNLYVIANDDGTGTFGYPTVELEECDSSNNVANGQIGCPLDAGITKDDGRLSYIPGGALTYEIIAHNYGPNFTGGIVSDPLPEGISTGDVTWTATTYGGATTKASGTMNGALQDTVDITAGDSIVYSVSILTPDNLTGDLVNVVSINLVGDTTTDNNIATDTDTIDCTFAISGRVNSRTNAWQEIGTVVSGFTYNFNTAAGAKIINPSTGPEAGQNVPVVRYNASGNHISLTRNRYQTNDSWWETISGLYDSSPPGWTGLSGTAPENAPILGFMAFIDQNGNGSYDSGTDEFIRDVNSLTISPTSTGQLYMAFYDNGNYNDNNGILTVNASIDPSTVNLLAGVSDTTICAGDSIQLDAGNSNAISWAWSNGESTQTIQVKSVGEYSVLVVTPGGCTARDTLDLDLSTVTVNLRNDVSICADSTVVLDAENPDASSWVWNDATATQTNSVNTANTYSVIVTDTLGCIGYDTITVSQIALIDLGIGNDTSICAGDSLALTSIQPVGSTGLLWNTGSSDASITINSIGIYTVLITDSNGCPHHDTLTLSINALPDVSLGNDTTICPDSSLTITSVGGTNWDWSTGETTQAISVNSSEVYDVEVTDAVTGCINYDTLKVSIASGANINLGTDTTICTGDTLFLDAGNGIAWNWSSLQTSQTIEVSTANTYRVDVTYASGCVFSDTIDVLLDALPTIELGKDTAICAETSITLDAGAATSWSWNWIPTATSQTIQVRTAGDYSVEITDSNGCKGRDTISITSMPLPVVNLGNDTAICAGDSIILNAGNGTGWTWNVSGNSQTLVVKTSNTYRVTTIDANSCEKSDTIVIDVNPIPVVNLGNDTSICIENQYTLDAENTGSTYLWSTGSTDPSIQIDGADTYEVIVTGSTNCIAYDTIVVDTFATPVPNLNSNDTSICAGDTIDLTAAVGFASYEWTNSTSTTNTASVFETNTYELTVTSEDGCKASETAEVTVNPLPEIGLDDSTNHCVYGPSLLLSVLESGADYVWSTGSTDQEISVVIVGKYWVDVTDDNACFNTDTITISSPSLAIVLGDDASVCTDDSVILDAGDFAFEIWNSTDTSATFTATQTNSIDVLAIDADGCFGRDTINITKNPNPTITIIQTDTAICDLIGETTTLSVANDEGMDINWNTGESGESITAIENGEFIATKTNEFACFASDTVMIDRLCEEITITLPNIFTPDGDGTNENFKPLEDPIKLLTYIEVISFIVYNRWGRTMYLSENLLPHWNGLYQDSGETCSDGVYYWVMKYTNVQGDEKATNGYVHLVR